MKRPDRERVILAALHSAALYRLTVGYEVILVADGLGFANGIALSADGQKT